MTHPPINENDINHAKEMVLNLVLRTRQAGLNSIDLITPPKKIMGRLIDPDGKDWGPRDYGDTEQYTLAYMTVKPNGPNARLDLRTLDYQLTHRQTFDPNDIHHYNNSKYKYLSTTNFAPQPRYIDIYMNVCYLITYHNLIPYLNNNLVKHGFKVRVDYYRDCVRMIICLV